MIDILLVEDNELARAGTAALIGTQNDMRIVGEATDGTSGLEMFRSLRPHIAMVDLRMPSFDGVQLTAALMREAPPARVLVLTHYEGDADVFNAIKAGALGYLTKDVGRTELFTAIRTVAEGKRYLPAAIAGKLADRMTQPALSPRELQVLEHIFAGRANKEIADTLKLSEKTVIMYVSQILSKMGAKSRTEAVSLALSRGILRAS
ncbi:MAG: response regulator transcription factor [Deltaproteobacteria bacterium]|nr:response regulator transcription factor [Deltaproteobacteria bacterium]